MKKILSIIASAMLIASCTSQTEELVTPVPENQEPEGQKVTLCATIVSDDGSANAPKRVSGKDDDVENMESVIHLTWDAGDKILITEDDDQSSVFVLSSGAGTAKGVFKGELYGDGSSYNVLYPANYDEEVLKEQTYVENGFGNGLMKMSTKTPGNLEDGFVMSADNALVGLQLMGDGAKVSKIEFTNRANSNTYALLCPEIELTDASVLFYIVVPSGEWAQGFKVTVYDASGEPIKDITKKSSSTFAAGKAIVMPVQPVYQKISVFSVSATQKVTFSPGNLQYHPKNKEWRFALNQLHFVGKDNENISAEYDGWIDMFGWSGTTGSAKFGVSSSTTESDYSGDFLDWGNNTISGYDPNTWRTLTNEEWKYLANARPKADELKGFANINGINGMILLPDEWECPVGITFKSGFTNLTHSPEMDYGEHQSISANQWAMMEQAGALFLPAYGYRMGAEVEEEVGDGYYRSATIGAYNQPRFFHFNSIKAVTQRDSRIYGLFVRLVKDL
jgi:hypothetical protein